MDPVIHFELPATDVKRISVFYTKVFDWKPQFLGADMGDYIVVATTEVDKKGIPKEKGMIGGGLYPRTKDTSQHPSVVISVDDIKASMVKVEKAGGQVHGMPQPIPGVGLFVAFTDTEGNRLSMLQAEAM